MMKESTQNFLIVIPCLNEEVFIGPLLQQLLLMTENLDSLIICADGGSTDETINIVKKLAKDHEKIRYLHNPKKIQSSAVNLAVQTYAQNYETIIRIDAHCVYPDDYIDCLLKEVLKTGADSICVTLKTIGKSPVQRAIAAAQNSVLGNGGSAHRRTQTNGKWVDHGHHALISMKAFQDIGGYDEGFTHNEDAELDVRLIQAGYKIWLTDKTYANYFPREDFTSLFKQYFGYGRGRFQTVTKHKLRLKLRQLLPLGALGAVILLPFSSLPLLLWAGICLTYGMILGVKEKDMFVFTLSGLAAMIMHFAWALGFTAGFLNRLIGLRHA